MADSSGLIASAVIVPELVEHAESPSGSKRRQSAASDSGSNKRPRLSEEPPNDDTTSEAIVKDQQSSNANAEHGGGSSQHAAKDVPRRRAGKDEERQRGRRLFGALLGTLSQSTNTTAQKRRADIEKKQRTKLREEAEEFDEKETQRMDELIAERKKEQKKYDSQSMRIRNSNILATASFLKTEAEPRLYYLPWQLRPEEVERIERQKKDASTHVAKEIETEQQELDSETSPNADGDINGTKAPTSDERIRSEASEADAPTSAGTDIDPPAATPIQPPEPVPEPETPQTTAPERESGTLEDNEDLDVEAEAGEDPLIY